MSDPLETGLTAGAGALAMKLFDFLLGRWGKSEALNAERGEKALEDHKRRLEKLEEAKDLHALEQRVAKLEEWQRLAERKAEGPK